MLVSNNIKKGRYITKQQHKKTCGHVAIANVLKYKGISLTYKEAIDYVENIKFKDKSDGCWPYQLVKCLDKKKINYYISYNNSTCKLIKLLKDNVLIWLFSWKRNKTRGAHFVFIEEFTKNKFKILNFMNPKSKDFKKDSKYTKKLVSKYIHHTRVWKPECYDVCIVIPK